jgi:potassium intermediate/small conductance calcium-activated channel subfamily N protein 2
MKYDKKLQLLKIDGKLMAHDNLFSSKLLKILILEIIICGMFFPPFLNLILSGRSLGMIYVYNLNAVFSVFIMFKLYVGIRILSHVSRWNSDVALAVCNRYKVKPGLQFATKAEMKKRPAIILTCMLLIFLFLLGFSLRTFEYGILDSGTVKLKGNNDLNFLSNCFWLVIVTMTTVGYGDYFPRSHFGRFVGVIACIIGMLILSMIVVSLSVIFEFSQDEKKAYERLKKVLAIDNMNDKAANIIKTVCMIMRISRVKYDSNITKLTERFLLFTNLKREITKFYDDSKVALNYNVPIDETLKRLQEKITSDLDEFVKNVRKLKDFENDMSVINTGHDIQLKRIIDVIEMQEDISEYLISHYNKNVDKLKKNQNDFLLNESQNSNESCEL